MKILLYSFVLTLIGLALWSKILALDSRIDSLQARVAVLEEYGTPDVPAPRTCQPPQTMRPRHHAHEI